MYICILCLLLFLFHTYFGNVNVCFPNKTTSNRIEWNGIILTATKLNTAAKTLNYPSLSMLITLPYTQRFSLCCSCSSGSHFNPPFTLAIFLCGGLDTYMVIPYLACQLIGGVLGAAMAKVSLSHFCAIKACIVYSYFYVHRVRGLRLQG